MLVVKELFEYMLQQTWVHWEVLPDTEKVKVYPSQKIKGPYFCTKTHSPLPIALEEFSVFINKQFFENKEWGYSDLVKYYEFLKTSFFRVTSKGRILWQLTDTSYYGHLDRLEKISHMKRFHEEGQVHNGGWWVAIQAAHKQEEFLTYLKKKQVTTFSSTFFREEQGLFEFEVISQQALNLKNKLLENDFLTKGIRNTEEGLQVPVKLDADIKKLGSDWFRHKVNQENKKDFNNEITHVRDLLGDMAAEAQGRDQIQLLLWRYATVFAKTPQPLAHLSSDYAVTDFHPHVYVPVLGVAFTHIRALKRWEINDIAQTPAQMLFEKYVSKYSTKNYCTENWKNWADYLKDLLNEENPEIKTSVTNTRSFFKFTRLIPNFKETEDYLLEIYQQWGITPLWLNIKNANKYIDEYAERENHGNK